MKKIKVEAEINKPREEVWKAYTDPKAIVQWNFADASWHCPNAENDVRVGGAHSWRMEAREGDDGFDYKGMYTEVKQPEKLHSLLGDGREVEVYFTPKKEGTLATINFEPHSGYSTEEQRSGWESILNNFKKFVEEQEA